MSKSETYKSDKLNTKDMMRELHLSRSSVYRRLREAREGRGGFPLPIPMGNKRRLLWNAETVRQFVENGDHMPVAAPPQPIESAAKRAARSRAAMKELEKFGIKIKEKENEK